MSESDPFNRKARIRASAGVVKEEESMSELDEETIKYPRDVFCRIIQGSSPYAFYLFQWVPYQTDAKRWRLKMLHDVKTFDGREAFGIWPNADNCGPFKDEEVEFIRISGEVLQEMEGEYDSYGRVFTEDREGSVYWENPTPGVPLADHELEKGDTPDSHGYWSRVCDLLLTEDESSGIAAVHSKCFAGVIPTTRSEDDPNQGWGDDMGLMGDCDPCAELS